MADAKVLNHVKSFIKKVEDDPSLLHSHDYEFFK